MCMHVLLHAHAHVCIRLQSICPVKFAKFVMTLDVDTGIVGIRRTLYMFPLKPAGKNHVQAKLMCT